MNALLKLILASTIGAAALSPAIGQGTAPAAPAQGGSHLRADDYRVARVAHRLAAAGTAFCPAPHPLTGLSLHYLPEYEGANRAEAVRRFNVDRGPGVLSVVENSPAMRAGFSAGDVLLAVNGTSLPAGTEMARAATGKKWRRAVEPIEDLIEAQLRSGRATFRVLRAGKELDLVLEPATGCPIRSRLARSTQANAFSDGRTAIVTTRLLSFIESDDELALVLAHEAAHNILRHEERLEQENVPTGFLANFGKNASRHRQLEAEADRLGLKLLWAAGYDVSVAIPFWRRLHQRFEPIGTPTFFSRHPRLAARERIVRETLAELSAAR